MKRLLALMLVVVMLTGCGHADSNQKKEPSKTMLETQQPNETASTKTDKTKSPKSTEKPDATASQEVTVTPEVTDEIVEGEVVTDSVVIDGMAEAIVKEMSLEEKVGQLFIVNLEQLDTSKGTFFEHRKLTKQMKKTLANMPVGGVIFFSRNIETRKQTTKFIEDLQANTKIPLFVAVDEEGGEVSRIASNPNMKTTVFPTMEEVAINEDAKYAYNMGKTIGNEIKELGFNLDFAPVADVRTNFSNTEIGSRSFGSDEKTVATYVKEVVKGLQRAGVSSTLKHFPGHGDADGDTHVASVNVDNDIIRMRKVDFVPFKAGIKAGADFIMVSHISISKVAGNTIPASLSPLVLDTMLRTELKFKGVVVTDAFDMKAITNNYKPREAAQKAIMAGADIVLMPEDYVEAYTGVMSAVKSGKISEERLNSSVTRILRKKIKRGLILSDTNLIYK